MTAEVPSPSTALAEAMSSRGAAASSSAVRCSSARCMPARRSRAKGRLRSMIPAATATARLQPAIDQGDGEGEVGDSVELREPAVRCGVGFGAEPGHGAGHGCVGSRCARGRSSPSCRRSGRRGAAPAGQRCAPGCREPAGGGTRRCRCRPRRCLRPGRGRSRRSAGCRRTPTSRVVGAVRRRGRPAGVRGPGPRGARSRGRRPPHAAASSAARAAAAVVPDSPATMVVPSTRVLWRDPPSARTAGVTPLNTLATKTASTSPLTARNPRGRVVLQPAAGEEDAGSSAPATDRPGGEDGEPRPGGDDPVDHQGEGRHDRDEQPDPRAAGGDGEGRDEAGGPDQEGQEAPGGRSGADGTAGDTERRDLQPPQAHHGGHDGQHGDGHEDDGEEHGRDPDVVDEGRRGRRSRCGRHRGERARSPTAPSDGADGGGRAGLDGGEQVGLAGRGAGEAEGGEALLAPGRADAGRGRDEHEHGQQQADGADAEHDAQEVRELVLRRVGADVADLQQSAVASSSSAVMPDDGDEVVGTRQVVVADACRTAPTGSGRPGGRRAAPRAAAPAAGETYTSPGPGTWPGRGGPGESGPIAATRSTVISRPSTASSVSGHSSGSPRRRRTGRAGVAGDAGVLPRRVALLGPDGRVGRGGHQQQGGADGHAERGEHEPHDALASAADGEAGGEADHRAPTGVVARPSRTTTSRSA